MGGPIRFDSGLSTGSTSSYQQIFGCNAPKTGASLNPDRLKFVTDRLPPQTEVLAHDFDEQSGRFKIEYKQEKYYGVKKSGWTMPGASYRQTPLVAGQISEDGKTVHFDEGKGLQATILYSKTAEVRKIEAHDDGDFTVTASTQVMYTEVPVEQRVNPRGSLTFMGWTFDSQSIEVDYGSVDDKGNQAPARVPNEFDIQHGTVPLSARNGSCAGWYRKLLGV